MASEAETTDETDEELTGTRPAIGSVEEANEWIGRTGDTHYAVEPVNGPMIRFYASMIRDGNPTYWDEEWADDQWGGICAPPGMMLTLQSRHLWSPEDDEDREGVSVASVPLPEQFDSIINTQTETIVHEQIRAGTWLNWETEVVDVSEEKETALGSGHFVTTKTYLRNERGELLAEDINSMLRYDDGSGGDAEGDDGVSYDEPFAEGRRNVEIDEGFRPDDRYESIDVESVTEGEVAHTYEYPVTYKRVIHDVAATRDFYPVHHDPEFARSSGTETIFLNTMALQGLVDRVALEWAGPEWRVAERTIRMAGSALAGEKLTVEATVEDVSDDGQVTLDVAIEQRGRDICPSSVTIQRG